MPLRLQQGLSAQLTVRYRDRLKRWFLRSNFRLECQRRARFSGRIAGTRNRSRELLRLTHLHFALVGKTDTEIGETQPPDSAPDWQFYGGDEESPTCAVKLNPPACVGVPLINPDDAFSVTPVGKEPDVIDHV